jgi:MYXO-CTERM domain-containing protein
MSRAPIKSPNPLTSKTTMNPFSQSLMAAVALAGSLFTAGTPALAGTVSHSFDLLPDFGSTLVQHGSFSFDDAQTPTLSPTGTDLYSLSSFTVELDGTVFDLADLADAFAVFSGGSFQGLMVTIEDVLTMSEAFAGFDASFSYVSGFTVVGGTVRFFDDAGSPVPEPAGLLLAAVALAAAARASRRRSA